MLKNTVSLTAPQIQFPIKFFTIFAAVLVGLVLLPALASMQTTNYTISGNVRVDGANLSGATVSLSGGQTASVQTGADGNYSFTIPAGASYTVSVYRNGINFNPASQSFTNLQANQTADFQNGTPLCVPPSSEMTAWYKGDGNAVDSAAANNGTNSGAGFTTGKVNQAFSLNGSNSYVQIPDAPANRLTDRGTINLWIYLNNTNDGVILDKGRSDNNLATYTWEIASGSLQFNLYKGDGGTEYITLEFPAAEIVGSWTQLTATWDAGTLRLYRNGVLYQTSSYSFTRQQRTYFVGIGRSTDTAKPPINGLLDEIQFHNRALSASEISSIYNAGSAGVCASGAVFTNTNPNGKIAFTSGRTGNGKVFTMNADGSNQTIVSNNAADEGQPAWSPDGAKIAFHSYRNGNADIYIMNADGSNQIGLATDAADDLTPSWSPDGAKIVFYSGRTGNGDIYVMDSDGSNQTRLTTHTAFDYAPKFSPDGSKIVFQSSRTGGGDIYVMNADGSNQTRLTTNSAGDEYPAYSPDGSKIAFMSVRTGDWEIFVMNSDGSSPVNLSNNLATDQVPAWSPDGTKISFETYRDGNYEIYSMNANGTNQTRLTNHTAFDSDSAWQPIRANVSVAPASNVNLTFANVTQDGNTIAAPIAPASAGALPSGYSLTAQSVAYDIRSSASYTGNITVTFNVPNVPDAATCASLRMLHYETTNNPLANITTGTNSYNAATQVCTVAGQTTSLSPFVIAQAAPPTAASVIVGGRVTTASGSGIRNVLVTLTASNGDSRTVLTGKSGVYRFAGVSAGETYIISVRAKRYTFSKPSQVRTVVEDLTDVDFVSNE